MSLRVALLVTAALWLMLGQLDGVLASLQGSGAGAFGANDFGGGPDRVADLLETWNANSPLAHAAFWTYTAVDVLFMAAYAVLFLLLFEGIDVPAVTGEQVATMTQRAAPYAQRLVLGLVAADLAEDTLRGAMVLLDSHGWLLVYAAAAITLAKWLLLGLVLLVLWLSWRHVGLPAGPVTWTAESGWALRRLRVPALLVTAWGLFLIFDPTGQAADTLRRWLDSRSQFAISAACGFGAAALLGLAVWTTARRAVRTSFTVKPEPPHPWRWVAAFVVLAAGALAGWRNLAGPAAVIAAVFGLEIVKTLLPDPQDHEHRVQAAEGTRTVLAAAPAADRDTEVRRLARGLAALPIITLLLGLASSFTAPALVLIALGNDTPRAIPAAVLAVVAVVLVAFLAVQIPKALVKAGDATAPEGLEPAHVAVAVVCALVCAAAIAWPLDVPTFAGAATMIAVAFAVAIVLLGEAQRYGDTHVPSPGLAWLGFARVPVTLLIGVALAIAAMVDDGTHHDVRRNDGTPPGREGTLLATAFEEWSARNCADAGGADREVPMVFVASHGGGIRAAYWTASVLTDLMGAPADGADDADCTGATAPGRVFAMAGASGGSVGVTSYGGHTGGPANPTWYRDALGDTDFVAVPTTWALLIDIPRSFVGFGARDRAEQLERIWEREDASLAEDFFATQDATTAKLLLAGTQVETGCRFNVSPLRLTARASLAEPGECAALLKRTSAAPETPGGPPLPSAALTSEVLDHLCGGGSVNRSTAALMSARFPYVSPSGRLERCDDGRPSGVVDGGYAENSGGQAILNLWARLEPLVAEHNEDAGAPRIVPIFLHIDNHYAKAARSGPVAPPQEVLVPPLVHGRTDKLDDRGVEQQANAEFSVGLPGAPGTTCRIGYGATQRYVRIAPGESPGIPAPLAWTLSRMAMDDLDRQRAAALRAGSPGARLRDNLTGAARLDCG